MCGSSAPAPPVADPRIGEAAVRQADLGQQYLDFAKDQFKVGTALQQDLANAAKQVSISFLQQSAQDRSRWETVFKPMEDAFVTQASTYDSEARQNEAASKAKADVEQEAAIERGTAQRRAEAAGISPASGRFAGIERAVGLGTTLGTVDAQNRARQTVRDTGTALRGQAINLGRNLPVQSMQLAQGGLSAAGVPLSGMLSTQGIVQPGYSAAITGAGAEANTLNSLYKTNVDTWGTGLKYDAANSAGIGQFAGTALGAGLGLLGKSGAGGLTGLAWLSSKETKTNRKDVPQGQSLAAVEDLPVQSFSYKPGMGDGGSHVGPMAEDMQQATGLGDGKTIAAQDAIGLALGAVKDLSAKVERISKAIGLGGKRPRMAMA